MKQSFALKKSVALPKVLINSSRLMKILKNLSNSKYEIYIFDSRLFVWEYSLFVGLRLKIKTERQTFLFAGGENQSASRLRQ